MDDMLSKQLCGEQSLGHASSCYRIEKTGGVAKQHRTAGNTDAGASTQGRRADDRGYLLRAVQSRSEKRKRAAQTVKLGCRVPSKRPCRCQNSDDNLAVGQWSYVYLMLSTDEDFDPRNLNVTLLQTEMSPKSEPTAPRCLIQPKLQANCRVRAVGAYHQGGAEFLPIDSHPYDNALFRHQTFDSSTCLPLDAGGCCGRGEQD